MTAVSTRDALGEAPLLRGASAHAVDELRERGRTVRLAAREWLFRAGEPADRLFVVVSGRLQVLAGDDGRPARGRERRRARRARAPDRRAALGLRARGAGLAAARDRRGAFVRLVEADGGFALSVARELARQLQASGFALPECVRRCSPWRGRHGRGPLVRPRARARARALGNGRDARRRRDRAGGLRPGARLGGGGVRPRRARGRPRPTWSSFCRRQCDRLVVVTSGDPPAQAPVDLAGCELVLVGVPAGAVGRWLDACRRGRTTCSTPGSAFAAGVGRVARRLTQRSLGVVLSGGGTRVRAHRRARRPRRRGVRDRPRRRLQHGRVHRRDGRRRSGRGRDRGALRGRARAPVAVQRLHVPAWR